jgi:hypothetical protein
LFVADCAAALRELRAVANRPLTLFHLSQSTPRR